MSSQPSLVTRLTLMFAKAQLAVGEAVRKLPFWPEVVSVSQSITAPLIDFCRWTLRTFPFLKKAEWLLEIESLTQRSPVLLASSLVLVFWRGLKPTNLGHIGTDGLIYPLLGLISGFNPFLGIICGAVFGVGDIIQKLFWNDIYGAQAGRTSMNYWGSILGYIVAYSSPMTMGILPGLMSRVTRAATGKVLRKIYYQRAAASADGARFDPQTPWNIFVRRRADGSREYLSSNLEPGDGFEFYEGPYSQSDAASRIPVLQDAADSWMRGQPPSEGGGVRRYAPGQTAPQAASANPFAGGDAQTEPAGWGEPVRGDLTSNELENQDENSLPASGTQDAWGAGNSWENTTPLPASRTGQNLPGQNPPAQGPPAAWRGANQQNVRPGQGTETVRPESSAGVRPSNESSLLDAGHPQSGNGGQTTTSGPRTRGDARTGDAGIKEGTSPQVRPQPGGQVRPAIPAAGATASTTRAGSGSQASARPPVSKPAGTSPSRPAASPWAGSPAPAVMAPPMPPLANVAGAAASGAAAAHPFRPFGRPPEPPGCWIPPFEDGPEISVDPWRPLDIPPGSEDLPLDFPGDVVSAPPMVVNAAGAAPGNVVGIPYSPAGTGSVPPGLIAAPPMMGGGGLPSIPGIQLGELIAALLGAAVGAWTTMQAAPALENPAFNWRPNPDVSCHNLERNILHGTAPDAALGGALGGAGSVLTSPPSSGPA
ncbi:MAG TPA: hypothetical protein VG892_05455, partial [Terriglobales bacterium]|nr:hypothetical protein [Terriglobales bacterium]